MLRKTNEGAATRLWRRRIRGRHKRWSKSRSRVIRIQRRAEEVFFYDDEPISSGRGAEQRSMERNYQSPARFRHVAAVVPPPLPSPDASPAKHSSDSPLNVSAVSLLALPFHPSILLSHLLRVPREVARNHESVSTYSWMWMKSWSDNRIALFRSHSKESGDLPRCGFFDLLDRKLLTKMRNFEGSDWGEEFF